MKHDFTTDPTHEKATNTVLHSLEETKHMKWASSQSPRFLAKGMLETALREMQPKQCHWVQSSRTPKGGSKNSTAALGPPLSYSFKQDSGTPRTQTKEDGRTKSFHADTQYWGDTGFSSSESTKSLENTPGSWLRSHKDCVLKYNHILSIMASLRKRHPITA